MTALATPDVLKGSPDIAHAIDTLASVIGDARIRVESGEAVDLTGLDHFMEVVCSAIGRSNDLGARALLPKLESLSDGLNALEVVIKRQRINANDRHFTTSQHTLRHASDVYGAATPLKTTLA